MNEYKTIPVFVKSIDEDKGIVTHFISVYGNLDKGDDIAHKGMFTKTLKERGDSVRVLDNHRRESILDVVGKPIAYHEISRKDLPQEIVTRFPDATGGMMVDTQFLLGTTEGKGVFDRIKAGAVSEFSIGYNTMDFDYEDKGGKRIRHLRAVRLMEYGPTIFAMNEAAVTVSAKSTEDELQVEVQDLEEDTLKRVTVLVGSIGERQTIQSFIFKKDEWSEDEVKELGLFRQMSYLSQAFNRKFEWEYNVYEVYDDYLIATSWEDPYFYKVGYTESAGIYTFTERDDWEVGTLEFVPTEIEADAKLRLIEFELAMLSIEAGPECRAVSA